MSEEERKYWIAFSSFIGIGPKRFSLLVKYFGSAKIAWEAPEKELREIGLGEKLTELFCLYRERFDLEKYLERMMVLGVTALTLGDDEYPSLLKEIGDAPYVLYIKTSNFKNQNPNKSQILKFKMIDLFSECAIAVVGTRMVTSYGREVTEELTSGLVANGLTIVSGMARGVDGIAHKTAIDFNGMTVAVLGSGIDIIYPPEHRGLYNEIVQNGAVISEFPLGYPAVPRNFPARNRIISGLSLGVLVTEAAYDSGSLITASFAGEQGREVFAVPGPITSKVSGGTSELLKKGAKLVSSISDILEELKIKEKKANMEAKKVLQTSTEEKLIIDILSLGQLHINNIALKVRLPINKVGSLLMILEMKGMVRNYGEMVYGIKKS